MSLSKHVICQDATPVTNPENGVPFTVADHNNILDPNSQTQEQQAPPSSQLEAAVSNANLSYEYSHPTYDQVYYAQHPAPPLPSQYQTMTPAAAVLFSQASAQLAVENTNSQNITS
ncbi:hypothetical protein K7X08_000255 [Anisodus acutangulus]|uniref:Uncharacterized protein n=1 Tax=Anisodus acutangulus TaxID=402998 RepID=A0A9Q1RDZ0_9SOLA|nr:hypothetical protein K7X08_000255 [Anisodus acutangulus]